MNVNLDKRDMDGITTTIFLKVLIIECKALENGCGTSIYGRLSSFLMNVNLDKRDMDGTTTTILFKVLIIEYKTLEMVVVIPSMAVCQVSDECKS